MLLNQITKSNPPIIMTFLDMQRWHNNKSTVVMTFAYEFFIISETTIIEQKVLFEFQPYMYRLMPFFWLEIRSSKFNIRWKENINILQIGYIFIILCISTLQGLQILQWCIHLQFRDLFLE